MISSASSRACTWREREGLSSTLRNASAALHRYARISLSNSSEDSWAAGGAWGVTWGGEWGVTWGGSVTWGVTCGGCVIDWWLTSEQSSTEFSPLLACAFRISSIGDSPTVATDVDPPRSTAVSVSVCVRVSTAVSVCVRVSTAVSVSVSVCVRVSDSLSAVSADAASCGGDGHTEGDDARAELLGDCVCCSSTGATVPDGGRDRDELRPDGGSERDEQGSVHVAVLVVAVAVAPMTLASSSSTAGAMVYRHSNTAFCSSACRTNRTSACRSLSCVSRVILICASHRCCDKDCILSSLFFAFSLPCLSASVNFPLVFSVAQS